MPVFLRWLLAWTLLGPWVYASALQLPSVASSDRLDFSEDCFVSQHAPWTLTGAWSSPMHPASGLRFGEARHPGPADALHPPFELPPVEAHHLRVGCSNPCGFRGKEQVALSLGAGIWHFSETHLTESSQIASSRSIRSLASQSNRHIRAHFGAPVGLRPNSTVAGTWSGVCVLSDFPSQRLQIPWRDGAYDSGRALLTRHFVGETSIQMGTIYGFPTSPTWPRHKELNQALFRSFTTELVVGSSGIRVILGDMNCSRDTAGEFEIWRRYGWIECQMLAQERWQQDPESTCKNSSQVDHIWLSPEAAALCRSVHLVPAFPDHLTLMVDLDVSGTKATYDAWPMPSPIPWTDVDLEAWHSSFSAAPLPADLSGSDFLSHWCQHWESSLDGFCTSQPDCLLPPRCKGRGQQQKPQKVTTAPPAVSAARPGEAALRSDFASRLLLRWYKQLRRIQSYLHAIKANKQTPAAIGYRVSVWSSIVAANGFQGGFASWYAARTHSTPASPATLPLEPPPAEYAEAIFDEFHWHFRRMETWMIRQRSSLLQAKYDRTCKALFVELRAPARDQLDLLWSTEDFTVLGIDQAGCQLHLDAVPSTSVHGHWKWQQHSLELTAQDGDLVTFATLPENLEVGDCLQYRVTLADESSIHQALLDLWKPRWQRACTLDEATWSRITSFIEAYMPRMKFPSPDLSLATWQATLCRFPARAARGVDGLSALDLRNLPPAATQQLLGFLGSLQGPAANWPAQLLYGKVINLAKVDGAHLAKHFRPVVIFGTIYRAWSRLCARPLLHTLSQVVPEAAFGFLPGRECGQIWLQLQAMIELCCQQDLTLGGFSTDLEKCFNNIGRGPLFRLASHVGFPEDVLGPWRSFLDHNVRAFLVRSAHSMAVPSTSGLPEGCAMSVIGMILIDWAYHVYMTAMTPNVHVFSYVDNLSVAGHDPLAVVSAFFSTICFFQLWGLPLGYSKTFCWGTSPRARTLLGYLGLLQCTDASELGGSMTYGRRRRNRCLKARGSSLDAKWERLRASRSPQQQKMAILPIVFWATALHGCAGCPVAQTYAADLRKRAVKALRLKTAGSNSMLRLTFAPKTTADPGFYQVWHTIQTFCRICRKTWVLLDCWRLWWQDHQGGTSHGPFGQLLAMLTLMRWTLLTPPLVMDHTGLTHDLLLLDRKFLYALLQDAWFQHVARVACTRSSMSSVRGLDVHLMLNYNQTLTSHEWGLQSALQSGSFIDKWTHGRYDVTANRVCDCCLQPNTHEHLLVCRKFAALRDKHGLSVDALLTLPKHFSMHLLCSRSPFLDALRTYFMNIPDVVDDFVSSPEGPGLQHVFTDGSCFADGRDCTHRGAWAVWNATSGNVISSGHLSGLPQTIARAELVAVLSALRWANFFGCAMHLWIDALHIHEGLQFRLANGVTAAGDANADLWFAVDQELANGASHRTSSSWIPSHLVVSSCESPFEEWVAEHNDVVDTIAVRMNGTRPDWLLALLGQQWDWDDEWSGKLCSLRRYYFDIFAHTHSEQPERPVIAVDSSDEDEGTLYSFLDLVDPSLMVAQPQLSDVAGYPIHFIQQILTWIHDHEQFGSPVQPITFLEITFGLIHTASFRWPYRNPVTRAWQWDFHHSQFTKPTLCFYYQIVRRVFLEIIRLFCGTSPLVQSLNRSELGVTLPLDGIPVAFDSAFRADISDHLRRYTAHRPIRRAADYARPV